MSMIPPDEDPDYNEPDENGDMWDEDGELIETPETGRRE